MQIHANQQLYELLTQAEILEGSVRIKSNKYLCYLDTIDWKNIMPITAGSVSIETWDECK